MNTLAINPYFAAASLVEAVSVSPPRVPLPRMAKLPMAPVNGSPVPHLTSLYHNDDPGPWGDRRYPGNCSGHLIRDLLQFFRVSTVYDPMTGSGTCQHVCRDLGIYCWSGDIHDGFDACEVRFTDAFDFVWIHPPYWRMKEYADNPKDLSREPTLEGFLVRYDQLIRACAQALKPGGKLAILMGDYSDREAGYVPLVYHTKRLAFEASLRQCVTDIIRFSHNASSSRKVYRSAFIPGLHDVCTIFEKGAQ
jgi:SAM-dependent methyltransferase